mmetsp:Transcript_24278/g.57494  ORF Transcript_24278/g.57494 Transcript_24278/m.57494 type:complete len:679 (+) Transcript_24278:97-2133(+)
MGPPSSSSSSSDTQALLATTRPSSSSSFCFFFRLAAFSFLVTISFVDLWVCPYSKVEESFQIQATHDVYYYGINSNINNIGSTGSDGIEETPPYDHLQYPGVVPRTFVGPTILATLTKAVVKAVTTLSMLLLLKIDLTFDDPMTVQFLARFFLLTANLWGWYRLSRSVDRFLVPTTTRRRISTQPSDTNTTNNDEKGAHPIPYSSEGSWLLLITACQFHMPYYGSRMLPNCFASVLVLQCYAYWFQGQVPKAASVLVVTTTIFRCDLLLLLFSVGLSWIFVTKQLSVLQALKIGILSGAVALVVSVPLDSMMWNYWVWPEGSVLYFNTVLGKSSDWGTEVWHWYFSSAIPKLMLLTILLVPLSTLRIVEILVSIEMNRQKRWKPELSFPSVIDTTWLQFTVPILGFVTLYSCLGHKEVRFIFPAVPILNVAAASGMAKLQHYAFYTTRPTEDNPTSAGSSSEDAKKKKDDDYNVDEQAIMNDIRWPTSSLIGRTGFVCGILCILLTLLGSSVFVSVSKQNYPGGVALQQLTDHVVAVAHDVRKHLQEPEGETNKETLMKVHVHIDNASAMSGVSLFGQRAAQEATSSLASSSSSSPSSTSVNVEWTFSKEGYEQEHSITKHLDDYEQFTHLLSEDRNISPSFLVVRTIEGSPRISISEMKIITQPTIYVLERRSGWWD